MSACGPDITTSPGLSPSGRDDVALLAVPVVEQRDARGAARVVLDPHHLGGDAELLAPEVHVAEHALVPAAPVPHGDPAVDVPAIGARVLGESRLFSGVFLVISSLVRSVMYRRAGEVGFSVRIPIGLRPPRPARSCGRAASVTIAFFQSERWPSKRPIRFHLPCTEDVRTSATLTLKTRSTAWRISTLLASFATWNVTVFCSSFCRMLFSVMSGRYSTERGSLIAPSASCRATTAARSTIDPRVTHELVAEVWRGGRDLEPRDVAGGALDVRAPLARARAGSGLPPRAERLEPGHQRLGLRLGQAPAAPPPPARPRPPWPPAPSAARRAASPWASPCRTCAGRGPNGLPPPFHWVARMEPCRARPVPFWRHGFRPPPRTSLRPAGRVRARAPVGQLAHHRLVQHRHVHRAAEHLGRRARGCRVDLPAGVENGNARHGYFAPCAFCCCALVCFTLFRTITKPPARAGHRAPQQDEVLLGEHAHHRQVEDGPAVAAHAPGQRMARPHPRGVRGGADGAGGPMEHRAVGGVAAGPAVALDAALEALALGHAHHVHELAGAEDLGGQDWPTW